VKCSLLGGFHLNRLQRKVLLVVLVIILVPVLVTGVVSAWWVTGRMDDSIERWIREAAQVNSNWLESVNRNSRLFADLYNDRAAGKAPQFRAGKSPIPHQLQPLARELGINLVQVFDPEGRQIYSSPQVRLGTSWEPGQAAAVLKADQSGKSLLAAVTIVRYPHDQPKHYRLVLGTLFDRRLLARLGHMSGLRTRLFYPRDGDFARAFSEEDTPLRLRLSAAAFGALRQHRSWYSATAENGAYWGLYTPVVDSSGRVEAVLFSGLKHHGGDRFLTDQAAVSLAVALLGTLVAAVTGYLLSRLVVRPVTLLHEGVMKVAAQDFRASVPIDWRDEIGDLARAFNSMAATLRASRDQQQREFQRDKIAALGELALAMAHEIRNPVGVINTATRLLERADDPQRRAELCRMTREECRRLDQLLRDFQQLARHRRPQLVLLDPAVPLERALQTQLTGRDGVNLEREFTHGACRIRADAELLQQAWVNLVRNALEAMDGAGTLRAGSRVEGNEVIVYLQDSGPGIPVELMTRLFEPFFTTKPQGSGLGLTLAGTLVQASGAVLEAVPGSTAGARFAMRFRIGEEQ